MSNLVQTGRKVLAGRQKPQWKPGERGWRGVEGFETTRWAGSVSNNSIFVVPPCAAQRGQGQW